MWNIVPSQRIKTAFDVSDGEKTFTAGSKEDAEWLSTALDEVTNTVVKLFCQNKQCKGFDGYITRTASDAKKTMYPCDDCGKPMTRKTVSALEKQKVADAVDKAAGLPETTVAVGRQSAASMRAAEAQRLSAAAMRQMVRVSAESDPAVAMKQALQPAQDPETESILEAVSIIDPAPTPVLLPGSGTAPVMVPDSEAFTTAVASIVRRMVAERIRALESKVVELERLVGGLVEESQAQAATVDTLIKTLGELMGAKEA